MLVLVVLLYKLNEDYPSSPLVRMPVGKGSDALMAQNGRK